MIPTYKNCKRYGGLTIAVPPLNLITFLLLPVYLCIKDDKKLERFNMKVCYVMYLPLAFVFGVGFAICNMVMIPFAYLKALVHKFLIFKRKMKPKKGFQMVFFLLFGIPLLIMN